MERKLNGLDMDTVLRGRFRIAETGNSELCLNPTVPPYIMIQTDDTIYLLGSHDGDETRRAYAWVAAQVE